MIGDSELLEVYFDQYCHKCKHFDLPDYEDPCNPCMCQAMNAYSHKPVYYEEAPKKKSR